MNSLKKKLDRANYSGEFGGILKGFEGCGRRRKRNENFGPHNNVHRPYGTNIAILLTMPVIPLMIGPRSRYGTNIAL